MRVACANGSVVSRAHGFSSDESEGGGGAARRGRRAAGASAAAAQTAPLMRTHRLLAAPAHKRGAHALGRCGNGGRDPSSRWLLGKAGKAEARRLRRPAATDLVDRPAPHAVWQSRTKAGVGVSRRRATPRHPRWAKPATAAPPYGRGPALVLLGTGRASGRTRSPDLWLPIADERRPPRDGEHAIRCCPGPPVGGIARAAERASSRPTTSCSRSPWTRTTRTSSPCRRTSSRADRSDDRSSATALAPPPAPHSAGGGAVVRDPGGSRGPRSPRDPHPKPKRRFSRPMSQSATTPSDGSRQSRKPSPSTYGS
ncbi:hypothetical protein SMICM304S_08319 [Streptomyces microflavus]